MQSVSPAAVAQLVKLAKRFQRALDSVSDPLASPGASAAGRALLNVLGSVEQSSQGAPCSIYLEPVVLKTQLVPSIVAYLERIPWAAATPQQCFGMLSSSDALRACAHMLSNLIFFPNEPEYEMAGTVLHQVRTRLRSS